MGSPLQPPIARPVQNALTRAWFSLESAHDPRFVTATDRAAIVEICNQPAVYSMTAGKRLGGRPYAPEDAERFLNWSARGWREASHFSFLIRDPNGRLCGTIAIKSSDLASAEIGYWMASQHPGVMTNAVAVLSELARAAGYRELFGQVRDENPRSAAVLRRVGFLPAGRTEIEQRPYTRFALRLG